MDSATSSIELIFQSCFELELINRKFAGFQQKKNFFEKFFYESHKRCFFDLTVPILFGTRIEV